MRKNDCKYTNKQLDFVRKLAYDNTDNGNIIETFETFKENCKKENVEADNILFDFYKDCVHCRKQLCV